MSKTISWPSRAIYIIIALALAISLAGIAAVPSNTDADPGLTKWTKVTTPSEVDQTIEPGSNLYDFAVGGAEGDVVYVIGEGPDADDVDGDGNKTEILPHLWVSTDGGATWSNKTGKLLQKNVKLDLPAEFAVLTQVAVAPDDEDFVVVAGVDAAGKSMIVGSTDGATKFYYTGDMTLGGTINPGRILCLDVSREVSDIHDIGVGTDTGYVLRYEAGGYWGAHWTDARNVANYPGWVASTAVTSLAFSPSWSADKTVLVISTDGARVWLQTGMWGTHKGWGTVVERASAVQFKVDTTAIAPIAIFPGVTGIALPSDYDGYESSMRRVYAYVDATGIAPRGGYLFRIDGTTLSNPCGPTGNPWLASIAYYGTHDEGDAMLGELANGAGNAAPNWPPSAAAFDCCVGVEVYRTAEIDVCCPQWTKASKPPSGESFALVAFTPDGEKAYATTQDEGLAGESAFSVSLDKGKCWNQLGLIDTDIDFLSDVAVSPDCTVTYLSSVNVAEAGEVCDCDSVWMKDTEADEYADVWQRVYHKDLDNNFGLLRLSPEHDDGDLVYWGDFGSENLYWATGKGICKWSTRKTTIDVQDFALADDDTLYVINDADDIVKWTTAKRDWTSAVDHMAVEGHTIAVLGDYILVGGAKGSVGYSDDAAATFSRIGDKGELGAGGEVHVAFDSYFEDNDTIYAALAGGDRGIWRWVIDDSTAWTDLKATARNYYGIVLDNADGNPMTDAEHGGVLYAAYDGGVARCLTPASTPCCTTEAWDYLTAKLGAGVSFTLEPRSLKICGCLTADTNSNLFAIDDTGYQLSDGSVGTVWTYEDCFAKEGVELTAVADDSMVAADPCLCCNEKFVLSWERLCNACEYDIQISLDEDFTQIFVRWTDYAPPSGENPSLVVDECDLDCNTTFYWRVRAVEAETGEDITSFWSDVWSFTVEAGPSVAIDLTAPTDGASDVVVTGVGFTWTSVADATSYDWVLSANADLSSPLETKTGLTGTAYTYAGTLEHDTSYFWQVTAMKDASVFSKSDIATFTTVQAPVWTCPVCGKTFPSEEALDQHMAEAHPTAPVTPTWVWIVIAIGAVLVIVVIVLIFRTRRV